MSARTLDNCSLIKRMVKSGIGEPDRYYNINRCQGYQRSEDDDEPCNTCINCRLCVSSEDIL